MGGRLRSTEKGVLMAIKYDNSSVRLWKGTSKTGVTNIGIRFNANKEENEIEEIYKEVEKLLENKYGKGK